MEFFIVAIIMIIIAVVIGLINGSKRGAKIKAVFKSIGSIEEIHLPKYLGGFKNASVEQDDVYCAITESDFVFLAKSDFVSLNAFGFETDRKFGSKEIGKIPRNSINDIILEDKSFVAQRLTATRILTLGIFSLAAPKKRKYKEYCIVFDWEDENFVKQNVVFEFSGYGANESSRKAFQFLNKYKKPKIQRLKPDEKKCPYCAEIIKVEAKVCKHCSRDI
ncbi:MAG TPA: zinc ribbon domain-containing protein [Anaerolineae bacterium]|nr:zinc ribbon domain-containing protein [Anaerolineae bacterium]